MDVIEVKGGVYLHKTQTNMVEDNKEHAEFEEEGQSHVHQRLVRKGAASQW